MHRRALRRLRRLEGTIDHLEAAVRLAAEPQVIRVGQERLDVRLAAVGQGLLEDGLQVDLDGVNQGADGRLAGGRQLGRAIRQGFLGGLEQRPQPRDPRRRQFLGLTERLDLLAEPADRVGELLPSGLGSDFQGRQPQPGEPVDHVHLAIRRRCLSLRPRLGQGREAPLFIPDKIGQPRPDPGPPHRRGLGLSQSVEMSLDLRDVRRALLQGLGGQDVVGIGVVRRDVE